MVTGTEEMLSKPFRPSELLKNSIKSACGSISVSCFFTFITIFLVTYHLWFVYSLDLIIILIILDIFNIYS